MTTVAWPADLPLRALAGSYRERRDDGVLRTPMEIGPAKVRRRYTATRKRYQLTLELKHHELAAWSAFLRTLHGGAEPFAWTHPVTSDAETVRLVVPDGGLVLQPTSSSAGVALWRLALELEVL